MHAPPPAKRGRFGRKGKKEKLRIRAKWNVK
jgi:hypothetical protein